MAKIFIRGELLAEISNITGVHQDVSGQPVYIDTSRVSEARQISVWHPGLAGKEGRATKEGLRKIELSRRGTGEQVLPGGGLVRVEIGTPLIVRQTRRGRPAEFVSNPGWRR